MMNRIGLFAVNLFVAAVLVCGTGTIRAASGSNAPIVIVTDSDFQSCGCVTGGSGSTTDPYVIGPLAINKTAEASAAVAIDGTLLTKSFSLFNLTIAGNGTDASIGILLKHINPSASPKISAQVTGTQTSIQSNGIGIVVENSSFVTLDGGNANPNGAGIGRGAVGTINKNFIGAIDIENSNNITVKGWQMSANGQDNAPDFLAFDPSLSHWGVGAVRLFGSTTVTIDHNAANNCTTVSFALFYSSHNTISNNTADYPFTDNLLITDGSSYNLASNNVFSTADFVGILIADPLQGTNTLSIYGAAHDNVIQGNSDHTDGPTGSEVSDGIAPAFVGGVVILNGAYNNTVRNNQLFASAGTDLGWAQAVPSSSSPNGVLREPPVVQCNVTVSEGGGGVANHNGNVWSGNTFKKIASCITQQ